VDFIGLVFSPPLSISHLSINPSSSLMTPTLNKKPSPPEPRKALSSICISLSNTYWESKSFQPCTDCCKKITRQSSLELLETVFFQLLVTTTLQIIGWRETTLVNQCWNRWSLILTGHTLMFLDSCFWRLICRIYMKVLLLRLRLQHNKHSLIPFLELSTRLLKTPLTFKPEDTLRSTLLTLKLPPTPLRFLTEVLVWSPNKISNTLQKVWNMLKKNFLSLTHRILLLNTSNTRDWMPWKTIPTTSCSWV